MVLTNGIDNTAITAALAPRVLWRSQGGTSKSGRYFEDFHPICNSDFIKTLQYNDVISGPDFTTYLTNLTNAVVLDAVNSVFNEPQVVDQAKLVFYRNDRLYQRPVIFQNSSFCGIKIELSKQKNYGIKVNSVALFFNAACTITLYLYNDMKLDPIWTKSVTVAANEQTVIDLSQEVVINYLTPGQIKGGIFYFGYYSDDLIAQHAQPTYYNVEYSTFKPINCMSFQSAVQPNPNDGSRNFNRYILTANYLVYGLNLEIETHRDITNTIVQSQHLMDQLIGLMMAARIMEEAMFSVRNNKNQNKLQSNNELSMIYTELNQAERQNTSSWGAGIRTKINQEAQRVRQGFMPRKGVTVGIK